MAELEFVEIDFNKLRQIVGQATDIDFVHHVVDHTATQLHAGTDLGIDEVQWNLHVDLPVLIHALEIDVQHELLERVHLHVAQQHLLLVAFERHLEY